MTNNIFSRPPFHLVGIFRLSLSIVIIFYFNNLIAQEKQLNAAVKNGKNSNGYYSTYFKNLDNKKEKNIRLWARKNGYIITDIYKYEKERFGGNVFTYIKGVSFIEKHDYYYIKATHAKGNIEDIEYFLEEFPDSPNYQEVVNILVEDISNIRDCSKYNTRFPNKQKSFEQQAYKIAKKEGVRSKREFLKYFPSSRHIKSIEKEIEVFNRKKEKEAELATRRKAQNKEIKNSSNPVIAVKRTLGARYQIELYEGTLESINWQEAYEKSLIGELLIWPKIGGNIVYTSINGIKAIVLRTEWSYYYKGKYPNRYRQVPRGKKEYESIDIYYALDDHSNVHKLIQYSKDTGNFSRSKKIGYAKDIYEGFYRMALDVSQIKSVYKFMSFSDPNDTRPSSTITLSSKMEQWMYQTFKSSNNNKPCYTEHEWTSIFDPNYDKEREIECTSNGFRHKIRYQDSTRKYYVSHLVGYEVFENYNKALQYILKSKIDCFCN